MNKQYQIKRKRKRTGNESDIKGWIWAGVIWSIFWLEIWYAALH